MKKGNPKEQSFTMLRRVPQGFVPLSAYDAESLDRIPMFADVRAEITMPRSLPRHRLYWVILSIVADKQDRWKTAEDLHTAIKVKLNYIEDFQLIDGSLLIRPRSIGFDKMDEIEFRAFFDHAMELISIDIIPGLDVQALIEEGKRKIGQNGKQQRLAHH